MSFEFPNHMLTVAIVQESLGLGLNCIASQTP